MALTCTLIFEILFFLLFGLIAFQMETIILAVAPVCFLVFGVFLLAIFLLYLGVFKISTPQRARHVWRMLFLASAAVMLFLVFALETGFSWDWGELIQRAANYTLTGDFGDLQYYARYPNNQCWLYCLTVFFKVLKLVHPGADLLFLKHASMVLGWFLVQLTIYFIWKCACLQWGECRALLAGILTILCLPLYLFAGLAYTDLPGMFFVVLIYYVYSVSTQYEGKKKVLCFLLMGAAGAVGYKIKATVFIVLIAIAIDMVIREFKNRKTYLRLLILTISFLAVLAVTNYRIKTRIPLSQQAYIDHEFPLTHWVMMGLGERGGYDDKDVQYTMSFPTMKERKDATIKVIQERLNNYGAIGTLKHVFTTKLKRTWGNSCFSGDDYIGRNPIKDTIYQKIFTQKGELHSYCLIYTRGYYLFLMLGICISALRALLRRSMSRVQILHIALFGIFLFLSIWECNSRYLLLYLPFMILSSVDGWSLLKKA